MSAKLEVYSGNNFWRFRAPASDGGGAVQGVRQSDRTERFRQQGEGRSQPIAANGGVSAYDTR